MNTNEDFIISKESFDTFRKTLEHNPYIRNVKEFAFSEYIGGVSFDIESVDIYCSVTWSYTAKGMAVLEEWLIEDITEDAVKYFESASLSLKNTMSEVKTINHNQKQAYVFQLDYRLDTLFPITIDEWEKIEKLLLLNKLIFNRGIESLNNSGEIPDCYSQFMNMIAAKALTHEQISNLIEYI